jgi:hypothetical protein
MTRGWHFVVGNPGELEVGALKVAMVLVTAVLSYLVIFSPINIISASSQLDSWIPLDYWILLAFALGIWILTVLRHTGERVSFYAATVLLLVMFAGIELREVNVRNSDTVGFLWGSLYVNGIPANSNLLHTTVGYLQYWPGYFDLVSSFVSISAIKPLEIAKILTVFFPLLLFGLIYALGSQVFKSSAGRTLFCGASLGLLPWVAVDAAPQVVGAAYLLIALFALGTQNKIGSSVIFYLAIFASVVTHGLTAYEICFVAFFVLVAKVLWKPVKNMFLRREGGKYDHRALPRSRIMSLSFRFEILVVSLIAFGIWSLQTSYVQVNLGTFLDELLHLGSTPLTYQLGYVTSYRLPAVLSAGLYATVLAFLLAFSLVLAIRYRIWGFFFSLLLACLVGITQYYFPFTSNDFSERLIEATFPFLAMAIGVVLSGMVDLKARILGIVLIALLIVSGFMYFYSHESVEVFPVSTNYGDSFLVSHWDTALSLGYFSAAPPPFALPPAYVTTIPTYYTIGYSITNPVNYYNRSDVIIYSLTTTNSLLYFSGNNSLAYYVLSNRMERIYASSEYVINLRT